jgi:hypothetical protein
MARLTDLNSGSRVYLQHIRNFGVDIDCLMTGNHNRLKLIDCAKYGISMYILECTIIVFNRHRLKVHCIAHHLLVSS